MGHQINLLKKRSPEARERSERPQTEAVPLHLVNLDGTCPYSDPECPLCQQRAKGELEWASERLIWAQRSFDACAYAGSPETAIEALRELVRALEG